VEAGKLDLSPEVVVLASFADAIRATFEPLAAQKKLALQVQIEADAPHGLHTDRQRLDQIVKNLVSNAIKFTETGSVKLSISAQADGMLAFVVADTGIGIAPDQQAIIFEAFRQADGTTSRKYGGTGLGLSISRDLATLMGGSISVASSAGEGSSFTLLLPPKLPDTPAPRSASSAAGQTESASASAAPGSTAPAGALQAMSTHSAAGSGHGLPARSTGAPAAALASAALPSGFSDDRQQADPAARTVLVIEDDMVFARILYDLAHEMHYRCLVAHTGAEGIRTVTEFLPDAIMLDLGLPDGSGMDVLQKLKSNPHTRHIPVHIVSATDRAEAALQLGAVGYAVKPVSRERLKEVFDTLDGKFTRTTRRVLLVEDDARQRESVILLIGDKDVEITAVATGEEGLAQLRSQVFDCMIIDLKLPDMQGHELLQRMATEEVCSFPPVIVYTGRDLTRDEEADLLKYSRSIIIKGARSPERLLDEVTLFLHKVEAEMSQERQRMIKSVRNRERAFEGRRVLLVDDDVRNIFSLTSALEQKGFVVEVARNGVEALAKLDEIAAVDLVLMDVMMPVMDGLEATRRLRADGRFDRLPVIAITAKAMKDDQEQCLKAGASDYLAKPIDLDRLYSLMRVWLPDMERLG
ncbi:MAG: response regulator, partial [Janthinobacterium lividum]